MLSNAKLDAMSARLAEPWYVVGPPWGDGTYVVSGHEDPHRGRFLCDCADADEYEDGPGAADCALAVARTRDDARVLLAEVRRLEALLAEVRRLEAPPDVSGVMTAAVLDRLRDSLAGLPLLGDARPLLAHADALQSLVRELYGVVADLHADDPGRQRLLERGRAEGREQAAALLDRGAAHPNLPDDAVDALAEAGKAVRALGNCRPPLPPPEAEREAARLREVLRQCLERLEWVSDGHGLLPAHFAHAIDAARAALGGAQ